MLMARDFGMVILDYRLECSWNFIGDSQHYEVYQEHGFGNTANYYNSSITFNLTSRRKL